VTTLASNWTDWVTRSVHATEGLLLDTDFTGDSGAPWPAPWTNAALIGGTTGGTISIQSNRGRLRTHDGSFQTARIEAGAFSASDLRIELAFRWEAVNIRYLPYVWFRSSTAWSSTTPRNKLTGYALSAGWTTAEDQGLWLHRHTDGSDTNRVYLGGIPVTFQANVDYRVKVEAVGWNIRAKAWADGTAEPGWTLEVSDSAYSSGRIALSGLSGGTSGGRQADFSTFTVSDLTGQQNGISGWTNWVTASVDADPTPLPLRAVGGTLRVKG
jgi:hypothetical protein